MLFKEKIKKNYFFLEGENSKILPIISARTELSESRDISQQRQNYYQNYMTIDRIESNKYKITNRNSYFSFNYNEKKNDKGKNKINVINLSPNKQINLNLKKKKPFVCCLKQSFINTLKLEIFLSAICDIYIRKEIQPSIETFDYHHKSDQIYIQYKDFRKINQIFFCLINNNSDLTLCMQINIIENKDPLLRKMSEPIMYESTYQINKTKFYETKNYLQKNFISNKPTTKLKLLLQKSFNDEKKAYKAKFNWEKIQIAKFFQYKINLSKNNHRKSENESKIIEKVQQFNFLIFKINWYYLFFLLDFFLLLRNHLKKYKIMLNFLKKQNMCAKKIQRKYRKLIRESGGEKIDSRTRLISMRSLISFAQLGKKKINKRAEIIFIKFLLSVKIQWTIRIKFFKVIAKIITIQVRWKRHIFSFKEKLEKIRSLWNNEVLRMIQKNENEPLLKHLSEITETIKTETISVYLRKRLNDFYQNMTTYLGMIRSQNRSKTLALRFLSTMNKNDENEDEHKIRMQKQESVLLNSTMDYFQVGSIFKRRNLNNLKNNITKTLNLVTREDRLSSIKKGSTLNSSLLPNFVLAENNQDEEEEEDIDSPLFIKKKRQSIKEREGLQENSYQKPVFMYIPEENELKEMILDLLRNFEMIEQKEIKLKKKKTRRKGVIFDSKLDIYK